VSYFLFGLTSRETFASGDAYITSEIGVVGLSKLLGVGACPCCFPVLQEGGGMTLHSAEENPQRGQDGTSVL